MNDAAVAEVEEVEVPEADAEVTETESAESEESAESKDESQPSESSTEKKKDGTQKRIDELTKYRREAERERDYYRNLAEAKQQAEPISAEPGKTLEDFDYDESKFATYLGENARAAAKAEVDREISIDRQARTQAEFSGRESDFSKDLDDYNLVTRNPDLQVTQDMLGAVQASKEGPALLYYLGKNPDVAAELASLPPLQMAVRIGAIEATKLVKPDPSPTKAPAPTPKLSGTAKASTVSLSSADADKLSINEWMNRRNKQVSK